MPTTDPERDPRAPAPQDRDGPPQHRRGDYRTHREHEEQQKPPPEPPQPAQAEAKPETLEKPETQEHEHANPTNTDTAHTGTAQADSPNRQGPANGSPDGTTKRATKDQQNPDTTHDARIGYENTCTEDEGLCPSTASDGDSAPSEPMWKNHVGGELQNDIPVPKRVIYLLEEALGDLDAGRYEPVLQRAMAHTWECQTRYAYRYAGGVPIAYRLWRRACQKDDVPIPSATKSIWEAASKAGLLIVSGYSYDVENPQSREFLIAEELCSRMMDALADNRENKTRYNLVTGDRLYGSYRTQTTYDGTHSWEDRSQLIGDVLNALKGQRDLVNRAAVEDHLDNLNRKVRSAHDDYRYRCIYLAREKRQILPFNEDLSEAEENRLSDAQKDAFEYGREFDRLHRRYMQDRRVWDDILSQGLERAADQPSGIFEYETAYEVQEASGRLTMICGLQNASKEMKLAAAEGIPGCRNYDIDSSQTHALIIEFENAIGRGADLDVSVLKKYQENDGKDGLEEEWGIGRERWKTPEHAIKFGAGFEYETFHAARGATEARILSDIKAEDGEPQFEKLHSFQKESGKASWGRAVYNELPTTATVARDWADDPDIKYSDVEKVYRILRDAYGEMAKELEKWREWLVEEYWPEASQSGGQGKGAFVKNPCDLAFSIHDSRLAERDRDEPNRYEKKTGFATSLLQGREAAFIHAVTLVQDEYDYEFLRNEHDGGVVVGKIPDGAVQDAKERSGFHRAELERQPFKS